MARRRRQNTTEKALTTTASCPAVTDPTDSISRRKVWIYRAVLVIGGPTLFLLLCESVLRLGGYGYETSFLVPATVNGIDVLIPNSRFTWRFFGPSFARQPVSFAIPRDKPEGAVRVFVFGESAAFGDPQPDYGLPRMLQAMLSLRYPGSRFEVVNAAMTGINSHAVLRIARDCARAKGDIWVIYMGNNEVVGPFGAGTVFGPQAPGNAIVRSSLAIKTTRLGQLLAALQQSAQKPPATKSEWGGMLMFLENQVRPDDPRMATVYQYFERNLSEILAVAQESGVGVVVTTVAVNLKDCAPFASQHRPGLAKEAAENWQKSYQAGIDAQAAGDYGQSIQRFHDAVKIDDSPADLQFALARSQLAIGQRVEAARGFALARDQDVLRFRCDSKLNEIVKQIASGHDKERIYLADAERVFAQASPDGVPGSEYFYEHVHLTFEGNYLLARTIAEQLENLLPSGVRERAHGDTWPSAAECARRLAWTDWHRRAAINDVLGRLSDPPFTNQSNHAAQMQRLIEQVEALRQPVQQALAQAKSLFEDALVAAPDDAALHAQLGSMLGRAGDTKAATDAARRAIELLPTNPEYWMLLGAALATQEEFQQAAGAFQKAFKLDDQNVWALQSLARAYVKLDRREDAMRVYRQAIEIKPRFGTAYLELGQLLESTGRREEAEQNYRLALENRIYRSVELTGLARFCYDRGWYREAVTNYLDAIKLSPGDATLHVNMGQCLVSLKKYTDARRHFEEAVRLAPELGQARFRLGMELGRANETAAAIEQFREAVRLMPDVPEARLNLGIALSRHGRRAEAIEQFRHVLDRSPDNAVALEQMRLLGKEPIERPTD